MSTIDDNNSNGSSLLEEEIAQRSQWSSLNYESELNHLREKYQSSESNEDITDQFKDLYQIYNLRHDRKLQEIKEQPEPEIYNCHQCHSIDSIKNIRGMNVCTTCGSEKGSDISQEMECQYSGMAVGDNSCTARTGLSNNKLLFQSNFCTKIVGHHTSYSLKQINNVWDSLDYKERTLLKIFKKIADNCRQNGIPNNVVGYSQVLYKQVYEEQRNLKKGNKGSRADKLEGLISGCIYYSCKAYDINRSHQEIADICGIEKKEVSYGCKLFFRLMHGKMDLNKNHTDYNDFIERYCSHLELNEHEQDIVRKICKKIYQLEILDHSKPSTMAAVSIFFSSSLYNFDLDKKEIAEQCNTTEPTLNKNYKTLMEYVEQLIV